MECWWAPGEHGKGFLQQTNILRRSLFFLFSEIYLVYFILHAVTFYGLDIVKRDLRTTRTD